MIKIHDNQEHTTLLTAPQRTILWHSKAQRHKVALHGTAVCDGADGGVLLREI